MQLRVVLGKEKLYDTFSISYIQWKLNPQIQEMQENENVLFK